MVEEFGVDTLESDRTPTDEETARLVELTEGCVAQDFPGGPDDTSDTSDAGDTSDGGDADAGGEAAPSELFSETDFAPVCRGTGIAAATPYESGDGNNLVVVLEGEDPDYGFSSVSLPDGWEADFETIADTELVTCLNRIAATPTELCEGYEDEGLSWSVQLHDSTYEVSVREATTGSVVTSATYDAPADGCPVFSSYFEGDPNPKPDYETPDAEIEVLLAELVTGSAPETVPPADTEAPAGDAGEPFDYGDDPELDALWDACDGGDLAACDELFFVTPVGSVYEEFGATCGGRTGGETVGSCAEG
jgi:hypothetical protein